jgi:hypothetical protein
LDAFYLLFIPGFTILAFLVGCAIAWFAMMDRIEPDDDEREGQPAH